MSKKEKIFDVAIIGAGPHGLAVLSALQNPHSDLNDERLRWIQKYRQHQAHRSLKVCVIDPEGSWLSAWQRQFSLLGITTLRSPALAHPDAFSLHSLLEFACRSGRLQELTALNLEDGSCLKGLPELGEQLFDLPSASLFFDFCQQLAVSLPHKCIRGQVLKIENVVQPTSVVDSKTKKKSLKKKQKKIKGKKEAALAKLHLDGNRVVVTKCVVLAVGSVGKPNIPPAFQSIWDSSFQYQTPADTTSLSEAVSLSSSSSSCCSSSSSFCDSLLSISPSDSPVSISPISSTLSISPSDSPTSPSPIDSLPSSSPIDSRIDSRPTSCLTPELIFHLNSWKREELTEGLPMKARILVVGGGLSAVQVALRFAKDERVSRLVLCSRRPLRSSHFDLPLEWMDRRRMRKLHQHFFALETCRTRLAWIKQMRNGGSVPPGYFKNLREAIAAGQLHLRVASIRHARLAPGSQAIRVLLSSLKQEPGEVCHLPIQRDQAKNQPGHNDDDNNDNDDNDNGDEDDRIEDEEEFDRVILATSQMPDIETLKQTLHFENFGDLPSAEGLPILTKDLLWQASAEKDQTVPPVYVVGTLAMLELGPDAANLTGARRAAQLIASSLGVHRRRFDFENPFLLLAA
jgi:hypothetical protein